VEDIERILRFEVEVGSKGHRQNVGASGVGI